MALADKATAEAALESHGTLKLEEDATIRAVKKNRGIIGTRLRYKVPGFR